MTARTVGVHATDGVHDGTFREWGPGGRFGNFPGGRFQKPWLQHLCGYGGCRPFAEMRERFPNRVQTRPDLTLNPPESSKSGERHCTGIEIDGYVAIATA